MVSGIKGGLYPQCCCLLLDIYWKCRHPSSLSKWYWLISAPETVGSEFPCASDFTTLIRQQTTKTILSKQQLSVIYWHLHRHTHSSMFKLSLDEEDEIAPSSGHSDEVEAEAEEEVQRRNSESSRFMGSFRWILTLFCKSRLRYILISIMLLRSKFIKLLGGERWPCGEFWGIYWASTIYYLHTYLHLHFVHFLVPADFLCPAPD